MDPIRIDDETDSGFQQFLEARVDKILQDFENFEKETRKNVAGSTDPEYTHNNEDDQHQFNKLLEDFDEFEKTVLPPYEIKPTNARNFREENHEGCVIIPDGRKGQDNYMIIQDEKDDEGQLTVEATSNSTENANVRSFESHGGIGVGSGVAGLSVNPANVTSYGVGIGGVVTSFMKYGFWVRCSNGTNVWRWMGGNKRTSRRRRRKRKNGRVCMTNAAATLRLESNKIRNRVSAARSYEQKQAYEGQLQAQIQKLSKDNELHKKLLTVLEGTIKVDIPQKPLKRTISGPV